MTGGWLSGSQALKADALDFLGDGLITLLAIVVLPKRPEVRARVALIQGLFLGGLAVGVLGTTAVRVLVMKQPDADVMGVLGAGGLAINLAAAVALVPYRTGDVNVRAVWLFSRNDALGNIAVVIAAGLVALTRSSWPDLAVAAIIAGLFLQSSWTIVRKAWASLRATPSAA